MKINIEMDITPSEFRELMGWPDVQGFQSELFDQIREKMNAGAEGYDPQSLLQPFLTQSFGAMESFQKTMGSMMQNYGKTSKRDNE